METTYSTGAWSDPRDTEPTDSVFDLRTGKAKEEYRSPHVGNPSDSPAREPVEKRLYALAERLRSSYDPQYAEILADFVRVGEPVVGLEILSDQLLDDEVGIEPAVFREIEELCRLLGLERRYPEQLQSRVREARPCGRSRLKAAGWTPERDEEN